jgi:cell division protein FtsB
MPRPRIFVSSTYYDLKHIRASLDLFIDSLGYDPILSEKGDIAYTHDRPLDESCYREAENSDIFVLIVGGRYGSEASSSATSIRGDFYERYESITKKEFESAISRDIPAYILIERSVYSEYRTFLKNKGRRDVIYAHADSVNIFRFIDGILSLPRNNPIQSFEKFEEIESWLRDQWAGLFREMLRRQSQQQQMAGLTAQVAELKETNETLRRYLEAVMTGASTKESTELIESEEKRLEEVRLIEKFRVNPWVRFITRSRFSPLPVEQILAATRSSKSLREYLDQICGSDLGRARTLSETLGIPEAQRDFNLAREIAGVPPLQLGPDNQDAMVEQVSKLQDGPDSVEESAVLESNNDITVTASSHKEESLGESKDQEAKAGKPRTRQRSASKSSG